MPGRRSDFAAVAFSFKGVYDYMGRRLKTPYRQNTAVFFYCFAFLFRKGGGLEAKSRPFPVPESRNGSKIKKSHGQGVCFFGLMMLASARQRYREGGQSMLNLYTENKIRFPLPTPCPLPSP